MVNKLFTLLTIIFCPHAYLGNVESEQLSQGQRTRWGQRTEDRWWVGWGGVSGQYRSIRGVEVRLRPFTVICLPQAPHQGHPPSFPLIASTCAELRFFLCRHTQSSNFLFRQQLISKSLTIYFSERLAEWSSLLTCVLPIDRYDSANNFTSFFPHFKILERSNMNST